METKNLKNHIKKVKPAKKLGTAADPIMKIRTTGLACIPSGGPPDSAK